MNIVAVQPAENSRPVAQQQQNTDNRRCSVYVGQHTSVSPVSGVGVDGLRR